MAQRDRLRSRRATHPKAAAGGRAAVPPPQAAPAPRPAPGALWTTFAFQALVVAALAIALYANTLGNGYAFDDGVVIRENA